MFPQILDMDLMFSYSTQIINRLSLPLALFIGSAFAFFLLENILRIFRKFQGHE